ncbi:Profilin family protein [Klebsormidium nitens]|uniref:Profilin family protein n=1 Tax=Klebsormidium nitens TaxID=105231 RepID=A0A1Y1HSQ6_KLENI|nr:Profilin family protein [Klebsormidium nitens]|eukprot:GAQ80031.1 Profilin family protein [Klebsormidium nitens]
MSGGGESSAVQRIWNVWSTANVGPEKVLQGAAILNLDPERTTKLANVVHAQEGLTLKLASARSIISAVTEEHLHEDYLEVANQQYLVTNTSERLYHARSVSSLTGAGLILVPTGSTVVLGAYNGRTAAAAKAAAATESLANELLRRGY